MTGKPNRELILCSGLQSGGTSLVSWCFLQRPDMDGVFDMENSVIHTDFSSIKTERIWVKMTIGSFRTADVMEVYRDMGFIVKPLLIVRDVRHVFSSLIRKEYGVNGNIAEEPPVRMRFRRFLDDWTLFREKGWPILSFEKTISDHEAELKNLTRLLGLRWDKSMLSWPKPDNSISYLSQGNETFQKSRFGAGGLEGALLHDKIKQIDGSIPEEELDWLEKIFESYNLINGYPKNLPAFASRDMGFPLIDLRAISRREVQNKYFDTLSRLERIRNHAVFGPLIHFWSSCINKNYKVFDR